MAFCTPAMTAATSLRCSSRIVLGNRFASTAPSTSASTSEAKPAKLSRAARRAAAVPKPSKHKTPEGTNAKPSASGRPNRYITRYGIPPLSPDLLATGSGKLRREEYEAKQLPDYRKIWRLEDELAAATSEKTVTSVMEKLEDARRNQPKRHALWAFFREKTSKEAEAEERLQKGSSSDKDYPGKNALAFSLPAPDASAGQSGRPWHADELRRKSFDDLHKLWYIILIERNALATQREELKRAGVDFTGYTYVQEQMQRCRKTMARIKYILNERRIAIREAQRLTEAAAEGDNLTSAASEDSEAAQPSFVEEEEIVETPRQQQPAPGSTTATASVPPNVTASSSTVQPNA